MAITTVVRPILPSLGKKGFPTTTRSRGGPGFDTLVDDRSGDVDKLYGGSTDDRLYASDGDYLDFLDGGAQDYSVFDEPPRRGDFCSGDQATDGTARDTAVDCEWGAWLDW
jgi:hypothetical protein